jgi:putative ABC transport system ATP-binding protein
LNAGLNMATDFEYQATRNTMWQQPGESRMRSLRIRNLEHHFGEGELQKQVLYDNSLDIYEGEIVIMTGPSGSGKTTLLTLIGTLRSVQQGSLRVLGRELRGSTPKELVAARLNIGFIFQAHNLFASLSAIQNVKMGMELFNFSADEMHERAKKLLERLGLGHRLHYKPDSLSGGQKQRVAIARGLAHGPRIVLADEPTAALDEKSGREVVTLFKEMAQQQKVTILMVTHDNRILDVADRIVNMVDGHIKSDVVVRESELICEFIQKLPAFRGLTPATLASIADKMWAEQHLAGDIVLTSGEPAEKFILIRHGEVEVIGGDEQEVIATLREGDCFGEEALLTGNPFSQTLRTTKSTLLYVLGKEDFHRALATSDTFRKELQKALFERQ